MSALLGEAVVDPVPVSGDGTPAGVRLLPVELLSPNPDQPRKQFTPQDLEELTTSIRDHGLLQPILVRPWPGEADRWQIIAGERRWRAAQAARLTEVPVIERAMDDVEVLEVAIIENVQRADLNPMEEASAYALLMERFGRTQDAVAGVVGKSRSHVANTLRLMQLPPAVQEHVMAGRLSAGHARALITAAHPVSLAEEVLAKGLNVRQTESLARQSNALPPPERPAAQGSGGTGRSADVEALQQDLADALGMRIDLVDRGGKGELTVRYASLEQLDELCRRLMRS